MSRLFYWSVSYFSVRSVNIEGTYKAWDLFIFDLLSETYTMRIQYEHTQTQRVGVAKEVINKRLPGLKTDFVHVK